MSAYVPTDWVDGTTPLDEAHLDKIEQGIADATDLALALDALPKIPPLEEGEWLTVSGGAMVWAPAPGGGGVDYIGDWSAAVAYEQGDIVLYNGVQYLAVNPGTNQTPPVPAAPVASAPLVIDMGTALPASPFDGQEFILVDSLTGPSYSWRFRYIAAKATNKWVFIGGSPLHARVDTMENTASLTYVDVGAGPSVTVPVAGIYLATLGFRHDQVTTTIAMFGALKIGAAATDDANAAVSFGRDTGTGRANSVATTLRVTAAAGDVLKMQYKASTAGTINFGSRHLTVQPVAVGG